MPKKPRGVVTGSAGNHAQAVALAARLNNIKSTIVLPERAPLTKIEATKALGAEVILHGASFDEAVAYSRELEKEHGFHYVHAFDDELVIAGQGTIGIEIVDDLPAADIVVVPIGGGGLISGIAIAVKTLSPNTRVIGVQSANVAPVNRSLKEGHPIEVAFLPTIADGIAVKRPGAVTLPIIKQYVDVVVEVTEDDIMKGIFHCVQNSHVVVEGAGAASVAALIAGKVEFSESDTSALCLPAATSTLTCLPEFSSKVSSTADATLFSNCSFQTARAVSPRCLATLQRSAAMSSRSRTAAQCGWLQVGRVGIELLLEVRDEQHGRDVIEYLRSAGYNVEREGQGDWE
jgi:Threonine dehydratase